MAAPAIFGAGTYALSKKTSLSSVKAGLYFLAGEVTGYVGISLLIINYFLFPQFI